jgi:hypothetical protein
MCFILTHYTCIRLTVHCFLRIYNVVCVPFCGSAIISNGCLALVCSDPKRGGVNVAPTKVKGCNYLVIVCMIELDLELYVFHLKRLTSPLCPFCRSAFLRNGTLVAAHPIISGAKYSQAHLMGHNV